MEKFNMNDMLARGNDEHSSDQDDGESNDDQDSQLYQPRSQESYSEELVITNTVDEGDTFQAYLLQERVQAQTLSVSLNEHSTAPRLTSQDPSTCRPCQASQIIFHTQESTDDSSQQE